MIEIDNLNKTFGALKALSGVSLKIEEGEMVALIGASGSGKSTLLRHLSGLAAADEDSGSLTVNGGQVQAGGLISAKIRRLRSRVGVVFQQFNLVGRLNVHTNVLLGALGRTPLWRSLFLAFSRADRLMALEALERVGIAETAWQRASTLSGGQQQRAAIARALTQNARVLLADEPIASLDPESSRRIMDLLLSLNQTEKMTVVVSLHQVDYALKYCPRAIALHHGRVVYDGPSRNLTPETLKHIYGAASEELFQAPPSAPPAVSSSVPQISAALNAA
ncbi:MAG: phosphonate ABC transporter ATP-binding protein [Deltaproteobacteria bacterium]|jgi:phosphonate transport system ATP-binding protein|nr:phosphonate ABC transporter ATP-binding protein [Deltaproteobacteria bacterium]